VVGLALLPRVVAGHGSVPAVDQVVTTPHNAGHLLLRSSYGLLQSRDTGQTWQWICEGGARYDDSKAPALALTGSGAVLLGQEATLVVSSADGCDWQVQPLPPVSAAAVATERVVALAADPLDGQQTWALVAPPPGGQARVLRRTAGDWQPFGPLLAADVQAQSLAVAAGPAGGAAWVGGREADGSWSLWRVVADGVELRMRWPQTFQLRVLAVAATGEQVYVHRVAGGQHALLRSADGGATWTTVLQGGHPISAFALAPDGGKLAVATLGLQRGLYVGLADGSTPTLVASPAVPCLAWNSAGLWVCGEETLDGFTLALSTDGGKTLQPRHRRAALAPLTCPSKTSVAQMCPLLWPYTAKVLGVKEPAGGTTGEAGGCAMRRAPPVDTATWLVVLLTLAVTAWCVRRAARPAGH
jgi:hypothetical protein